MKLPNFQRYSFALKMQYTPAIGGASQYVTPQSGKTICISWVLVFINISPGERTRYNYPVSPVPMNYFITGDATKLSDTGRNGAYKLWVFVALRV
jgi:hypothetical protein